MAIEPLSDTSLRLHCGDGRRRAGLTLVEVMVASAMIALTCTTFMYVFTQLNTMAMVNRLYVGAQAAAENEIDLISTDAPFEPKNSIIPTELNPGTTTQNINVYNNTYADPVTGALDTNSIPGVMTTTVTTMNTTYANGSVTDTLYLYQATVTVTFSYRNRNYSVSMNTLRTSDI